MREKTPVINQTMSTGIGGDDIIEVIFDILGAEMLDNRLLRVNVAKECIHVATKQQLHVTIAYHDDGFRSHYPEMGTAADQER